MTKKTDLNKLFNEQREKVKVREKLTNPNYGYPNSILDEAFKDYINISENGDNTVKIKGSFTVSEAELLDLESNNSKLDLLSIISNSIFAEKNDQLDDPENILSSIEDCIKFLTYFKVLSNLLIPEHYQYCINFCRKFKESNTSNKAKLDLQFNICKIYTLGILQTLVEEINATAITEGMSYEYFEYVLNLNLSAPIKGSIEPIPLDTIPNILKGIKRVFRDFELPDWKLYKDYASRALCNNLNYMIGGSAITSGCKALRDSEKWTENHLGKAFYQHNKADNSESYITHYINDWTNSNEIELMPYSEAEQILEKFGVYPALLHLILAVHFYRHPDPTKAELNIKGSDLIKDLGLHKRTDLSKKEKLERVNETLTAVKSLIITAKWESEVTVQTGKKYTTKTVSFTIDPSIMWNISSLRISDKDLCGNEELKDIEIVVRAGAWLSHFFNQSERELGKALYNYATLSRKILDLNPYQEELALRIALLQSTMDYRGYYTVEKWLNENLLGAKIKIADAKIDRLKRKKLADLWNNTLMSLERIGFEIHFDNKTYPEELRPQSKRKPKGYFDRILQGKIKLTPESLGKPESDLDAKAKSISSSPKLPEKIEIFRGEDLRKKRESLGITQPMIAKYLFNDAKKKMYVSRIENNQNLSESKYNEILDAINYIGKNISKFK